MIMMIHDMEIREEAREEGFLMGLCDLIREGSITPNEAAVKADMTIAEFEARVALLQEYDHIPENGRLSRREQENLMLELGNIMELLRQKGFSDAYIAGKLEGYMEGYEKGYEKGYTISRNKHINEGTVP